LNAPRLEGWGAFFIETRCQNADIDALAVAAFVLMVSRQDRIDLLRNISMDSIDLEVLKTCAEWIAAG